MTNKIRGDFLIENLKDENSSNDFTLRSGTAEGVVPFYLRSHRGPGTIREFGPPPPPPFHQVLANIATPRFSYRFADGTNHGSYGSGGDVTITSSGNKATFVSDSATYPGFIGYFNIPDLSAQSSGVRDGAHYAITATATNLALTAYARSTTTSPANARSWIVVWYQASAIASGRRTFQGQASSNGGSRIYTTSTSFNSYPFTSTGEIELLAANATGSIGAAQTLSNVDEKLCIVMDTWDGSDLITYWKQTGHSAGHTKIVRSISGTATHLTNGWQAAGALNYNAHPLRTLHQSIINATLTPANFDTLCAAAGL
jgi:hypothetical protein